MGKKRIALAGFVHETNGFSSVAADLDFFRSQTFVSGHELLVQYTGSNSPMGGAIDWLQKNLADIVPLLYITGVPRGKIPKNDFSIMVDTLIEALCSQQDLDGILLVLHGAMMAEGTDDCEGEILCRVKAAAGNCPIVATLDYHANISRRMVETAHALVGYRENPHNDMFDRGAEAADILYRVLRDNIVPEKAFIQLPLLMNPISNWTDAYPMVPVTQLADRFRRQSQVINITVCAGFAYADTLDSGASILVQTIPGGKTAWDIAHELASCLWDRRQAALYSGLPIRDAIAYACFHPSHTVLIADLGDNIGGGAPGDATFILEEMLHMKVKGALFILCDPQTVASAGNVGEAFTGEVGGKTDAKHGRPICLEGNIVAKPCGRYEIGKSNHFAALMGKEVNMGPCVVLRNEWVDILITSYPIPHGDPEMLYHAGLDPKSYKIIVLKGAAAFRAAFREISKCVLDANTDGACCCDLRKLPYRNLGRQIYPLHTDIKWNVQE